MAATRKNEAHPATVPGMGAVVHDDCVSFRVWAPHADRVFVAGDFNDWADKATPLAKEDGGYWSTDVPGARPGQEYRYLIINGKQELWRLDPYARALTSSTGNSIIVDPSFGWEDGDFKMPAWDELVIYEMHVGTFNVTEQGKPGSFLTAIDKLDYLRDLGISAIQVMPPTEFPGDFSWGYNAGHPFAVESAYGGPLGLKQFVNEAHKRGIAVIMDVVFNHVGPNDNALWQFDGWSENDGGGIYFYNDWRAETPWGHTRPDYTRGEVRQYIRDNALMWLEEYHCDGLRFDATAYTRHVYGNLPAADPEHELPEGATLLKWLNEEIQARQPWKFRIAEDLKGDAWMTRELERGGAGFNAQWDPQFVGVVRGAIVGMADEHRDMEQVAAAIQATLGDDPFDRVIFTESHDEDANGKARVPEEIAPGDAESWYPKKRSTLGAALVFTAPGVPMLFQGQEMLEDKWFHEQDPLDWSHFEDHRGIIQMYTDLFKLRRNWGNNTAGLRGMNVKAHHVNNANNIIAFHRWKEGGPGDAVVVVANFSNAPREGYEIGFPDAGVWKVRFNSDWQGYDPQFGQAEVFDVTAEEGEYDGLPYKGKVNLGAYGVVILSQERTE
jgi:1,4-alpha-glucan branching enzyme